MGANLKKFLPCCRTGVWTRLKPRSLMIPIYPFPYITTKIPNGLIIRKTMSSSLLPKIDGPGIEGAIVDIVRIIDGQWVGWLPIRMASREAL